MERKNKYLIMLFIFMAIVTIAGTFAWLTYQSRKTAMVFTVGSIDNMQVSLQPYQISGMLDPVTTYTSGVATEVTAINNNSNSDILFELFYEIEEIDTSLASSDFKYTIVRSDNQTYNGDFTGAGNNSTKSILKEVVPSDTTYTYTVYLWIDGYNNNNANSGNFMGSLKASISSTYNIVIDLPEGLIPVTIANNGAVTAVSKNSSAWYDYDNQEWANAVLLTDDVRNTYQAIANGNAASTLAINDTSKILAYFVYIPRYKYAIPELTCANAPNVNINNYPQCYSFSCNYTAADLNTWCDWATNDQGWFNDVNECRTTIDDDISNGYDMCIGFEFYNEFNDPDIPVEANFLSNVTLPQFQSVPKSINIMFENSSMNRANGTAINTSYYTHPAFTFDNKELDGIWVGKFETSADPSGNCFRNSTFNYCQGSVIGHHPRILPNVNSIRYQEIYSQFRESVKFAGGEVDSNNVVSFAGSTFYGLTVATDSHLMKNSEWGAVAYLSHSKYGINTEIRNNNYRLDNNTYKDLTGCGAANNYDTETNECAIPYGTPSNETLSYPQSTTGNITGIFDMAGGSNERVMGTFGSFLPYDSKYYNVYDDEDDCTLESCGGHALYETNSWYDDSNRFVSSSYKSFIRGSWNGGGTSAGIFAFDRRNPGSAGGSTTFRVALVNVGNN